MKKINPILILIAVIILAIGLQQGGFLNSIMATGNVPIELVQSVVAQNEPQPTPINWYIVGGIAAVMISIYAFVIRKR
jgi:uncharacterized membrane protein